jgi:tRNA (guanine10-N2)-methyltransferase
MKEAEIEYCIYEHPKKKYFGVLVTEPCTHFAKYDLKRRPFLGPTSTSHDLAFLMANFAELKAGDFVLDPFVGTGSILVACSHFNTFAFGSDIDVRVIQGYKVGKKAKKHLPGMENITRYDIFTNFNWYNLPLPMISAMDWSRPSYEHEEIFDAIVCDPPYGVRARSQKTKTAKEKTVKYMPEDE